MIVHEGNVDVRYGIYRMQADRIVIYEADNRMEATGSVVFDQGDDQRITGSRGVWNYRTKLGVFENSTGFTNQTNDGSVIFFTADRVERVSLNEVVVTKGKFTACDEAVPTWSFTADEARIRPNDKIKLKNAKFRLSDAGAAGAVRLDTDKRTRPGERFLTPTIGYCGTRPAALRAYYQTLGRSADATLRADVYTGRGVGYGST